MPSGSSGGGRDDRAATPVLGDVLLVGVAVVVSVIVIVFVFDLTGVLSEDERIPSVEFTYDERAVATVTDSFGTTNADGNYDGLLTITVTHGPVVPASQLSVSGASSLNDSQSWAGAERRAATYHNGTAVGAGNQVTVWVRENDSVTLARGNATVAVWPGA